MSHVDPRFTSVSPGEARRGEPGWMTRALGVLIRVAVLAMVVLVVLVCREFVSQKRETTEVHQAREADLRRQLDEVRGELADAQAREQRLLSDPTYLEYTARDRLDLAREGETVIVLGDDEMPKD